MININLKYSDIQKEDLKKHLGKIEQVIQNFQNKTAIGTEFSGWESFPNEISNEEISKIENAAKNIRKTSKILVVCGIGGSYLGTRAVIEAIKRHRENEIELIYMGNTLDEDYTLDIIDYIKDKDFSVNVISKSGGTLETAYAFRILKNLLEEKYGKRAKERIYVTTDPTDGKLLEIAKDQGYTTFSIPKNIGGRFSVFTAVGLLPISVSGINIREFLNGAKMARKDVENNLFDSNLAYIYAAYRYEQYIKGKKVEIFSTYKPSLSMIAEWWKQLFGESEGKDGKGLFPASVTFTTDLHSLGQFIQQGSKIFFVTQIKVKGANKYYLKFDGTNKDELNYLTEISLNEINNMAQEGTSIAHHNIGKVDIITFEVDSINEISIGYLLYMFMYSCMISAYMIDVNPFDQPGVEYYKKELKKLLKK